MARRRRKDLKCRYLRQDRDFLFSLLPVGYPFTVGVYISIQEKHANHRPDKLSDGFWSFFSFRTIYRSKTKTEGEASLRGYLGTLHEIDR